jgi:branched-chain amino acid transport system ATP-binding protein
LAEEPLLKVSNIDVFYGGLQALWDVSLAVYPGEIVAIIGSNGAGKSTLLNTISGVVHPVRGSVNFGGREIAFVEPFNLVALGISLVPEAGRTFPNMTVLENLTIGSYNRKARAKKRQNLDLVYAHLPVLKHREHQLAKTLSGGERQMLAIGRGLMSDPKLMLLDEISLGLGPIVTNEIYKVLREIRAWSNKM